MHARLPNLPVLGPQRLEMNGQANLATPIHLCSLSLELRYFYFWCRCWIRGRNVKLHDGTGLHKRRCELRWSEAALGGDNLCQLCPVL